jgi:methylmalonyl-CoA/ethylmalonyl-CoA epimerase
MNLSLSHVAIAVPSLERAAERLQRVYGLSVGEVRVNAAQGVRMAYVALAGGGRIELIEPLEADSGVGRFLARNPGGAVHHLALATPGLDDCLASLAAQEVKPLGDGKGRNVHGDRICFVHPKDFLGVLVEIEEAGE